MFLAFGILLFLAVFAALAAFRTHRSGAGARLLQRRLQGLGRGGGEGKQIHAVRDLRYSSIPVLDEALRRLNLGQRLELLLYQAGVSMRAGALVAYIAGAGLAGYLATLMLTQRMGPALIGMAAAAPLPYLYVKYRKHQRMKAFAEEFPDALDLLVSALRAGLSFAAAMQIVAEESPEPVRGEFAVVVEEQSLGLDFRETMVNLTRRVDSLDLRFFITAVILQRDTGGNLAEILENTSRLIRDRFRVLGDIKTFTAQGRLTGGILLCLPLSISAFMFIMTPAYFKPMMESDTGRSALWFAAFLQLLGALVIRKIVNIRV